jgi:hypothetical protein
MTEHPPMVILQTHLFAFHWELNRYNRDNKKHRLKSEDNLLRALKSATNILEKRKVLPCEPENVSTAKRK